MAEDVALSANIRELLWDRHALPPVRLASGRGRLFDKFHAVLHSVFLEGGGELASNVSLSLAECCDEVIGCVGDMGVEFGLPTVMPAPCNKVFPWMPLPLSPPVVSVSEEDEWFYQPAGPEPPKVSFERALQVAGLQHVVHNATKDMLGVMPYLAKQVDKLTGVADVMTTKALRERVEETCFASPVGLGLRKTLRSWTHAVYDKRWRSVCKAVGDALRCETSLRWGWDLELYMSKETSSAPSKTIVEVDETIRSDVFWHAMRALEALAIVVDFAAEWSRGCPCHSPWLTPDIDAAERARWLECPLRTMRLPELCAGDLLAYIRDVCRVSGENLLRKLASLTHADKDAIIADFYKGQTHLIFIFAMKLAPYEEPPLLLPACAHHERHVARSALQRCRESTS